MNKDTRKRVDIVIKDIENSAALRDTIISMVEELNAKLAEFRETFDDARTMIEEIRDEEQEKYDNLSEGLQASEKGQNLESAVSALEEALSAIDGLEIEDFEFAAETDEIITALDDAKSY